MSHLQFEANLIEAVRMDGELTRGPPPRWQRKALEQGLQSLSISENASAGLLNISGVSSPWSAKTPHSGSFVDKSPGRGRGKSPGRAIPKLSIRGPGQKTPSRKTPSTPLNQQDSTTDVERSHHLLVTSMEASGGEKQSDDDELSLQQKEYQEKMTENLNDGQPPKIRILSFKSKAPQAKEDHVNNLKVLYSAGKVAAPKAASTRHIPNVPEKVLDAPELVDDYYLHLLDWSINNHLAVALSSSIYIWNAGDGSITPLAQLDDPDYVCSLSWIKEGNVLAMGLSSGLTQLWDVGQQKLVRTMGGHSNRVTTLSWNSYILSSGSRSGQIFHHDVRIADHHIATLVSHTQEVCGLKWSPDGRVLASGANDNQVNIWEQGATTPLHTFTDHQAAIKAVAWCPWQNNLLATGGGTADRTIRLWNCTTGICLKDVQTNSQVSSILWSSHYKELISGHGFSNHQLTLWKYPTMCKVADLTGHTGRVLELCLSPDGQMVVSAAADETIRMWKCWAVDKKDKKQTNGNKGHPISMLARTIR
ncbi:cell division cycle protein 20 homolog isoform X5 [Cherax quadricarinatus]|uniref:cell division cycle protein 20 homolog isoform X5 n=1 Tax=Cherax quadricarinatus TaxID=27406 RepID=UPI00237880E6|nr:cell division cycle protein 20 homolog isoform X5 [Cherax quadricarinatus]